MAGDGFLLDLSLCYSAFFPVMKFLNYLTTIFVF